MMLSPSTPATSVVAKAPPAAPVGPLPMRGNT
jgi:hypothetical protein